MEGNIQTTVREFEKFINFNESESPVLSAKQGVLGKKDSYRLNEMLSYNRDVKGPNYTQNQYPIVDLLFTLSLAGRLHVKASNDKGKPALIETNVMESYKSLNQYEKYAFLLQTYWTKYDFRGKFDTRSGYSFYALLNLMANAKPGLRIIKNNREQTYGLFSFEADFFHHLRFFGFGELEEIQGAKGKFEDSIRAFIPNEFGIHVSKFLLSKGLPSWNIDNYTYVLPRNSRNKPSNPFDVFREIFPDGKVINTVDSEAKFDTSGVYTFKVSLSKSCWRKINISHRHTLYDLHIAIQDAFDFDNDHLYAFYIGGTRRTGKPIYCADVEDDGGGKTTEEMTIEDLGLYKGQKIYYLFDFGDMWEFELNLIKIDKNSPLLLRPIIIKEKGEAPLQYPIWE